MNQWGCRNKPRIVDNRSRHATERNQSTVMAKFAFLRVVRRCFLLGNDPVTGKNYDHRKIWIEDQLKHLAANFGIDLLSFAILSNHFHLILRSRPDVVAT